MPLHLTVTPRVEYTQRGSRQQLNAGRSAHSGVMTREGFSGRGHTGGAYT